MLVITIVVAVFTAQLFGGISKETCRDGETVQGSKVEVGSLSKLRYQGKNQEEIKRTEEKSQRRVARENEPAPKNDGGSRENEPGSSCWKNEMEGSFRGRLTVDWRKLVAGSISPKVREFLGTAVEKPPGRCVEGDDDGVGEARFDHTVGRPFEVFHFKRLFHHCPTGCPKLGERTGGAMEVGKSPCLAAMRVAESGSMPEDLDGEPWTKAWFNRCPGHGTDQWIETLRSEGWLVRSHSKWRARTFHPLQKSLPLDAKEFTGVRVSVGFDEENNKVVRRDD